jgi:hypothetical protein
VVRKSLAGRNQDESPLTAFTDSSPMGPRLGDRSGAVNGQYWLFCLAFLAGSPADVSLVSQLTR